MIKKLDEKTINLISAGEVIECPADILKELIENAIDAKASTITITVKNAGFDLIEIKDDGNGVSKQELPLIVERHTTSKLEKIDDLYSLDTFGFRGEALASINAVSKLKISTSNNNEGIGYSLENNEIKEIPFSKGTTLSIKDLFFNVPVRKKFLKSTSTEFSKLYNVFLEFSLLNAHIKFQFISEKKNIIFSKTTAEGRYIQIFGKDIISKSIFVNIDNKLFKLSGILCKPTNYFYFPINFLYINNRPVYSSQINKLVSDLYKDYLMIQQKPFFVLFFKIDSSSLDVNIHPKKRNIKIQNEFLFLSSVRDELQKLFFKKEELRTTTPISSFLEKTPIVDEVKSSDFSTYPVSKPFENTTLSSPFSFTSLPSTDLFLNNIKIISILGQILDTFIVCKIPNGVLLIDQHAAEERINLEKNRKIYVDYLKIQTLISPKEVPNLNLETKEFIFANKKLFLDLGFDVQEDKDKVYLKTIPEFLDKYFSLPFFYEIIKNVEANPKENLDKIKDKILKLKSCKESIKANDLLSISQMNNLIKKLNDAKDNTICAHGRPTYLIFEKKDLEKMFKRIV